MNYEAEMADFLKEITISLFLLRTLVNIYSKIILSFKFTAVPFRNHRT